ncbi:MAG: SIMPL domain-containing protein [Treponema sp.]|jgi:hypothetical protein|nr:SIMPL domain-containing protein [Treponema sp.]
MKTFIGTKAAPLVLVMTALFAALLSSCRIQQVQNQPRTITVTGSGTVKIPSNKANIKLSVITRNNDVVEATKENAEKMAAVKKAIREAGVPFADITTSNYAIMQEDSYQNGRTIVQGQYVVSNQVNVTMSNVSNAGAVIDAAVRAGANQLSSLSYTAEENDDSVKQARLLAIKQAEEKANTLVTASGATLGKVLSIVEERYPDAFMANAGLRNAVDDGQQSEITGGDYLITVSVTASYEIL